MSLQDRLRRPSRAGNPDRTGERGQVLVLVALGMVVLLGAVGLGIDGSRAFEERRAAQAAVDHAATSAAHASCEGSNPADSITAGLAAANRNGYNNNGTTNTVTITEVAPTGSFTYRAVIDSTIQGTFSRVIGFADFDITVEATGGATGCGGSGIGGPGAIYGGGDTCGTSSNPLVDVPGSKQKVYGGVHSNYTSRVGGSNNEFTKATDSLDDPFTYVTSHQENGSNNVYQDAPPTPPQDYPKQVGIASPQWPDGYAPTLADSPTDQIYIDYLALAVANGTSFTNKITDITKDGVYYTTHPDGMDIGNVNLPVGDANGQADVVLVAPNGPIKLSVSDETFNPYGRDFTPPYSGMPRTGLLILSGKTQGVDKKCDDFVISLSGGGATWNGIVWGPGGLIEFNGSSNSAVNGTLLGWGVRLNGSEITITFDTTLFEEEPAILLLQ